MLEHGGIKFYWLGHDGFRMISGGKTIYTDPYKLSKSQHKRNDADVVLISHNHFDHMSLDDLAQVVNSKTIIVCARECAGKLKSAGAGELKALSPGESTVAKGIEVQAVAAYNTNKTFHPKADGKVGFVFSLGGARVYHTGDTDEIPEMSGTRPDIVLVPVSGTYVMTASEAAHAVNERIKPTQLAIPMHYGAIVGSEKDAKSFSQSVTVCPVKILQQE